MKTKHTLRVFFVFFADLGFEPSLGGGWGLAPMSNKIMQLFKSCHSNSFTPTKMDSATSSSLTGMRSSPHEPSLRDTFADTLLRTDFFVRRYPSCGAP